MDLISREALVNDLCEDREEGTFEFTDSQAEAADKIIVYVTKIINAQPSVPAVPLDEAGHAQKQRMIGGRQSRNGWRNSMISAWWLVLIVPACVTLGVWIAALMAAGRD